MQYNGICVHERYWYTISYTFTLYTIVCWYNMQYNGICVRERYRYTIVSWLTRVSTNQMSVAEPHQLWHFFLGEAALGERRVLEQPCGLPFETNILRGMYLKKTIDFETQAAFNMRGQPDVSTCTSSALPRSFRVSCAKWLRSPHSM